MSSHIVRNYPDIRIWHVGCATGEEVYSMAILLHEEGVYEKAKIYATDINTKALESGEKRSVLFSSYAAIHKKLF